MSSFCANCLYPLLTIDERTEYVRQGDDTGVIIEKHAEFPDGKMLRVCELCYAMHKAAVMQPGLLAAQREWAAEQQKRRDILGRN